MVKNRLKAGLAGLISLAGSALLGGCITPDMKVQSGEITPEQGEQEKEQLNRERTKLFLGGLSGISEIQGLNRGDPRLIMNARIVRNIGNMVASGDRNDIKQEVNIYPARQGGSVEDNYVDSNVLVHSLRRTGDITFLCSGSEDRDGNGKIDYPNDYDIRNNFGLEDNLYFVFNAAIPRDFHIRIEAEKEGNVVEVDSNAVACENGETVYFNANIKKMVDKMEEITKRSGGVYKFRLYIDGENWGNESMRYNANRKIDFSGVINR